jgi:DNA-binding response OmpR family regulator
MTVLIAEDDPHTRRGLAEIFASEGYHPLEAADGREALKQWRERKPDAVCLDIMMPGLSGYDVCREIRKTDTMTPILFISAKSEEIDTVVGLELGADDFITKPFGLKAVVARLRAVTRRCFAAQPSSAPAGSFTMGDLRVLPAELRAVRGGAVIDLSLRDVKILHLLYRERGRVVTRDQFFDEAWGLSYFPSSRSLDQHISQLRKRIEINPAEPQLIKTVHGSGYRWE